MPRLTVEGEDGWYHLWNAAAGPKRAFPLQEEIARNEFIRLRQFYARITFCRVAAFEVPRLEFSKPDSPPGIPG